MTAWYMFRLLFLTFFGKFRGTEEQQHHLHESPAAMTIPLVLLAILSIAGGWIGIPEVLHGHHFLNDFLTPVFAPAQALAQPQALDPHTEIALMIIATVLIVAIIIWTWRRFKTYREEKTAGFGKVLENKWYVDELYNAVIGRPLRGLSLFFDHTVERSGIDGIVNGVGKGVKWSSRQIRLLQSGQVGFYIFAMVIGMIILLVIGFFL